MAKFVWGCFVLGFVVGFDLACALCYWIVTEQDRN